MRFWFVLLLLYSAILQSFGDSSSTEDLQECTGGYCVPLELCPSGYLPEPKPVELRIGDDGECVGSNMKCCKNLTEFQTKTKCQGGVCVPKSQCSEGSYDESKAQNTGLIQLRMGDTSQCPDDSQTCCPIKMIKLKVSPNSPVQCGKTNDNGARYDPQDGSAYAKYAEFPWVVAILETLRGSGSGNIIGAGSLVHPRYVLSAAHMFQTNREWIARFGEWDLKEKETHPIQDIKILPAFHIHPGFDNESLANDICLLELERSVAYQHNIRPICLPKPGDHFNGQRCIGVGWGLNTHTNQYANVLKRVELRVIPRKQCIGMLRATRLSPFFRLQKSVLCAGGELGQDMCDGDGGGPLACLTQDGSYALAGIVSWGLECNLENVPGAYVNVSMFVEWITSKITDAE